MNALLLKTYHRLPFSLRCLTGSLRGAYLRAIRYGAKTEQWVSEALEREQWSSKQWDRWLDENRLSVLHRAATRVPYYREQWEQRRRKGDCSSWEQLENWPILEKDQVRQEPERFVADDCQIRSMTCEATSGTTGTPLKLWRSRTTMRKRYALFEARTRIWYGVTRKDRWGILGGQLVADSSRRKPPFWIWNAAMNQLYMSSYHLAPALIPYYLDAISRYKVKYLAGYPSSLYALANAALRANRSDITFKVVVTNAEPLYEYQRECIAQAFACPVRETYGMAEIVLIASECEEGTLHLWPEAGILEVLENGVPVKDGDEGELICTGLLNPDMPLIRYRVGDRGSAYPRTTQGCDCGRTLPRLGSVSGRSDDILYALDGRPIGRLDPIFKSNLPIRESQIIQTARDEILLRCVPDTTFNEATESLLIREVRGRMGNVRVKIEKVREIPRTSSGKFQAVINMLPKNEMKDE